MQSFGESGDSSAWAKISQGNDDGLLMKHMLVRLVLQVWLDLKY